HRRPDRGQCAASPDPALWDRRHAGVVRRRHLCAAQAGGRVRAAAGIAAAGAGRPRYLAARRSTAIGRPPRYHFLALPLSRDCFLPSGLPTIWANLTTLWARP